MTAPGATTSGTFNWTVSNGNDAPVAASIEGTALAYNENDGAVAITSTLTLNDIDDTDLEAAIVQITGNYTSGEDLLTFTDQNGITGTWNSATGTLTLNGTSSVANYQAALQSITYTNTSDDPTLLTRTVAFTVNDGDVNSNTQTRDITLAGNESPTAVADTFATASGQTLTVTSGVLANDVDVDGDVLTAILVSGPSHGTLAFAADGSFVYTSRAAFAGTDTFTYVAADGVASSVVTTVTVTVQPLAPPPSTTPDPAPEDSNPDEAATDDSPAEDDAPDSVDSDGTPSSPTESEPAAEESSPRRQVAPVAVAEGPAAARVAVLPEDDTLADDESPETPEDDTHVLQLYTSHTSVDGWSGNSAHENVIRQDEPTTDGIDLDLPSVGGFVFEVSQVYEHLDTLARDLDHDGQWTRLVAGTTVVATGGLSVGVALWTARAGYLITMLSSSLPVWAGIDPIPVLDSDALDRKRKRDQHPLEEESLATILENHGRRYQTS